MEVMTETMHTCEAKSFHVAVAIVDTDGVIQIEARGDDSPIHSQRFAYRKAYTIMSMGPVFGINPQANSSARSPASIRWVSTAFRRARRICCYCLAGC